MNKKQQRVCKATYKENCYILVSASFNQPCNSQMDLRPIMSFFYDAGDVGTEWEPRYGPIQIWYRCDEGDEGAEEHYFYDWHKSPSGSWSQLAVERECLPEFFVHGEYDAIFSVLEKWADR